MSVEIIAFGLPAPQGSKRYVGRGIMVESSQALKPWREAVKWAALDSAPPNVSEKVILDGPLSVRMVFTFNRPRSHYRTGRNAELLRDNAPLFPHGKPDLSKLIRSTEDALVDAGVIRDDCLIVECQASKVYVGEDDALNMPGVRIGIEAAW